MFIMFVGISAYSIDQAVKTIDAEIDSNPNSNTGISENDFFGNSTQLKNVIFVVIGMSLLSLLMCVVFVLLTKSYPTCMVYGVISSVSLILVATSLVLFFVTNGTALAIMLLVLMAIYLFIMFCCFKKHLKTAIVIVKVSGTFLTERPMVYIIHTIIGLITLMFTLLWATSITELAVMLADDTSSVPSITLQSLITVQGFAYVFFTTFSYYIMVFLVASCVAIWYYQSERSMLGSSIRWLVKGHIGSLTFAALVITIIQVMKIMAQKNSGQGNACSEVCRCICICLVGSRKIR
jgi:hypothetical protein